MLVPDFMHEFELGVWKSVFTHLIRMLVAQGGTAVQQLNTRYVPFIMIGKSLINFIDIAKFRHLVELLFVDSPITHQL